MSVDIDTEANEIIIREPAKRLKVVPVQGAPVGTENARVYLYQHGRTYYVGRVLGPTAHSKAQCWNKARNRAEADLFVQDLAKWPGGAR